MGNNLILPSGREIDAEMLQYIEGGNSGISIRNLEITESIYVDAIGGSVDVAGGGVYAGLTGENFRAYLNRTVEVIQPPNLVVSPRFYYRPAPAPAVICKPVCAGYTTTPLTPDSWTILPEHHRRR
ncbi:MAG: hypothetical protein FWB72_00115 [Firmicutes bacterium]|nr:hypothetical protein [Bacillota bacterium]